MRCCDYITKNLVTVVHPYNGSTNRPFLNLYHLADLCKRLLTLPENQHLAQQLDSAVAQHQDLPAGEIAERMAALRSLVGVVEPFLKAIGRIRHAGNAARLASLDQAMLKNLLEQGLAISPVTWDAGRSGRNHDQSYWVLQDCLTAVAYRVYQLRNEISHETPAYPQTHISVLFDTTVALLVFAIHDPHNQAALEWATSSHRVYLEMAAANLDTDYNRYVPLQASLRWDPGLGMNNISALSSSTTGVVNALPIGPLPLRSLLKEVDRFVLTGGGGAGKTKSLLSIGTRLAREAVSAKGEPQLIPVYLPAYSLFGSTVQDELVRSVHDVPANEVLSALEQDRYIVMVDALNEVSPQTYPDVIQLLKSFMLKYRECPLIVSTRQESYHNELMLPVYELQPLRPHEIHELLRQYSSTPEAGDQMFARLAGGRNLLALFRTPLMGRLLCDLPSHIVIPKNIGEMMRMLFERLFEREQQMGVRISRVVMEFALTRFARLLDGVSGNLLPESDMVREASVITSQYDPGLSAAMLVSQLMLAGILERGADDQIRFFHETALDYYLAIGYREFWSNRNEEQVGEAAIPPSTTATEILAGVLDSADDLIDALTQTNLHLAARCYGALSRRSLGIKQKLITASVSLLQSGETANQENALRALAALDEPEATRLFFDWLPQLPPQFVAVAQEVLVRLSPAGSSEEVLRVLSAGTWQQRRVALYYVGRTRLAEAAELVISVANIGDPLITTQAADALGRLETPEVLNYLRAQAILPPDQRCIPLYLSVAALAPSAAPDIMRQMVDDLDVHVRRAAISQARASNDPLLLNKVRERLEDEHDFTVRLLAAEVILESDPLADHVQIVQHVFKASLPGDATLPANSIIRFVNLLDMDALGEALLQALCCSHRGIQSLVSNRVFKRSASLALNAFDLINLSDTNVTSGVKSALIEAVICQGACSKEAIDRAFSPGVPVSVRKAAVEAACKFAPELLPSLLPRVWSDDDPHIRAYAPKLLAQVPELLSDDLLALLLTDPDPQVHNATRRLIANRDIYTDEALLSLENPMHPVEVRLAVVSILVQRGYHFPIEVAHRLSLEPNPDLRCYGKRILSAISQSRDDHIGIVIKWDVRRGFGFIRHCNAISKTFFHISRLYDRAYEPRVGDLVGFELIRERRESASGVTLLSRISS